MLTLVTILHILISIGLIAVVLLQDPKGGAAGMFGGGSTGSQSVFGATGASNFLTSATKWLAIAFGITCILLTYFTSHTTRSVTDSVVPQTPIEAATPDTSAPPAGTPVPAPAPEGSESQ